MLVEMVKTFVEVVQAVAGFLGVKHMAVHCG